MAPCVGVPLSFLAPALPGGVEAPVLTDAQYCAALAAALLVGYAVLRADVDRRLGVDHPKRMSARSWCLTLLCSPFMFAAAVPGLIYAIQEDWTEEWAHAETPLSRATVMGFVVYLYVDLIVGFIDYREQVDIASGWIHHIMYIGMLSVVCWEHLTQGFLPFLLEELSTVVLALGFMQFYRNDWLTGAVFFAVRVAFHVYMQWVWWRFVGVSKDLGWYYYLLTPAGFMNLNWFVAWARGQLRRLRKSAETRRLAAQAKAD